MCCGVFIPLSLGRRANSPVVASGRLNPIKSTRYNKPRRRLASKRYANKRQASQLLTLSFCAARGLVICSINRFESGGHTETDEQDDPHRLVNGEVSIYEMGHTVLRERTLHKTEEA